MEAAIALGLQACTHLWLALIFVALLRILMEDF